MRVIGHRGAAALAPENTLVSFVAALHAGVDAVELDARLTADGALVLMHDDETLRTTGVDARISEMTLEEVRALDAARGFEGWQRAEQVPTLEEVLDLVGGRVPVVLEVKPVLALDRAIPATPVVEAIVPLVADVPDLVVSSFDIEALRAAHRILPDIPTAVACFRLVPLDWALQVALDDGHIECHVPEEQIEAPFVERAHDAGVGVVAWTVNDGARACELRDMGVDGVFTDDPRAIRAALGA